MRFVVYNMYIHGKACVKQTVHAQQLICTCQGGSSGKKRKRESPDSDRESEGETESGVKRLRGKNCRG